MMLVVDVNITNSALISTTGITREMLFSDELMLISAEYLRSESEEHEQEIKEKSGLTDGEFKTVLELIFSRITFVSFYEYEKFIAEAKEICPDPDDVEYFALALRLKCPIWSNDQKLKKQDKIKVYNTSELKRLLTNSSYASP